MNSVKVSSNVVPRCVVLSDAARSELQELVTETNYTSTELTRLAYGLLKVVLDHAAKGHKVIVEDSSGLQLCKIALPDRNRP